MPTIRLLAFAQARDVLGFSECTVEITPEQTPRQVLMARGWNLKQLPGGTRVAVNLEYHSWDEPLAGAREIAILPPVSGG